MALLLLVPLVPIYIVASLASEFYSLSAMPIGSLYMVGLALTLIPLVLMPSKIKSDSKLKLLRTVLLVACALFVAVTVFASTSPTVSGQVPTTITTHPHTFTYTTRTYTYATRTTQCAATTLWEYYVSSITTVCSYITTGATVTYSTTFSGSTTGSSYIGATIVPTRTVTYGVSILVSPIILEPKTTITYVTTLYAYSESTTTVWETYRTVTGIASSEKTVITYTTWSSATHTYTTSSTVSGLQVEYTTVIQPTTVTVTTTSAAVTVTVTETPTTVYGYLARDSGTGAIYYIYGAKKYYIVSMPAYLAYGFRLDQWKTASAAELAYTSGYNLNGAVPLPPLLLSNGALMGDESNGRLYFVANGTKYWITSMTAFSDDYLFDTDDIIWVPNAHTTLYSDGTNLTGAEALPWP